MWKQISEELGVLMLGLTRRLTLPHGVAMLWGLEAGRRLSMSEAILPQVMGGFFVLVASVVFAGAEVAEAIREGQKRGEDKAK